MVGSRGGLPGLSSSDSAPAMPSDIAASSNSTAWLSSAETSRLAHAAIPEASAPVAMAVASSIGRGPERAHRFATSI